MSLRAGRGSPEFERVDATELAEQATGRALTPGEVSSYWTGRTLDYITAQPGDWLRLLARKARLLVSSTEDHRHREPGEPRRVFVAAPRCSDPSGISALRCRSPCSARSCCGRTGVGCGCSTR